MKTPRVIAAVLLWAGVLAVGIKLVLGFEFTAGGDAPAPAEWPAASAIGRHESVPALLLFVHPRCPCTHASAGELARLLARSHAAADVRIVVFQPADAADSWVEGAALRELAALPGVRVVHDPAGREARRFHAATSGHALLYGADGRLLFDGGITASRGHAGSNAGAESILALLAGSKSARPSTPVFGCPILTHPCL